MPDLGGSERSEEEIHLMNLRIAVKVLKRDSEEIHQNDRSSVPPRLVRRANRRWQRWIRTHVYNHKFPHNPSRYELHDSTVKTRRCQSLIELKRLWLARVADLDATCPEWLNEALARENGRAR
jgi:hypothetical protein